MTNEEMDTIKKLGTKIASSLNHDCYKLGNYTYAIPSKFGLITGCKPTGFGPIDYFLRSRHWQAWDFYSVDCSNKEKIK